MGLVLVSRMMYPSVFSADSVSEVGAIASATTAAVSTSLSANAGIGSGASAPVFGSSSLASLTPNGVLTLFSHTGDALPPKLQDEASLVADIDTGTVFERVNDATRWPMASLTKLMTATLVFDDIDLNATITITPQMFAADPEERTLVVGGTYSVNDLLHALLLPSSNVAAEAFADYYGRARFMDMMNARAVAWGMTNTYFDDPSGISSANQSTPDDLLKLAQKVYQNYPQIFAITRTPEVMITELNSGKKVLVQSINDFAGAPDFVGGKTGHTIEADGNLLSVFNYDGHPFIVIVFGSNDRFGDTKALYNWFKANYS